MPKQNAIIQAFNRGRMSVKALSRVDLENTRLFSEVQTNWMSRTLGSMMLRPGQQYIGTSNSSNFAQYIPFIFSVTDTAIIELTDSLLRVRDSTEAVITRVSVSTAIINGTMAAYLLNPDFAASTGWTANAGWVISGGIATGTLASTDLEQTTGVTLIAGKSYSLTFTMTRSAGTLTPKIGGTSGTARSSSATFTETIVAGASQLLEFTGAGFTGTVDTITIEPTNTGWLDMDESGATSTFTSTGYMSLTGTNFNKAIRIQQVAVSGGDQNHEHALRLVIERGPVLLRVGSTSGGQEYISEQTLGTGIHSLTLTPTGDFYIWLANVHAYASLVDTVSIEASGAMTIATPWPLAALPYVRYTQSGDVIYCACDGYQQRKIERRSTNSWSVVKYEPEDGPFMLDNFTTNKITPSATSGDITLTATSALFASTNVGGLYRVTSLGQQVTIAASGADQWSTSIRVTGGGTASQTATLRTFDIDITGTWVGTVRLQRSLDVEGSWVDVTSKSWTANTSTSYNDGLTNQIVYYRIGIKTAEYTSGTATASLTYSSGGITGVARITAYTSATSVSARVITNFGGTDASAAWAEGAWSDRRGYPTSVCLYEGRSGWAGRDKLWCSESDSFEDFDDNTVGDAGPISRSIGEGPVDVINWLLPMQRLIVGAGGAEWVVKSTTFDEPLTPTNFNIKSPSTQGSAAIGAVKIDSRGVFVQRGGTRVFEIFFNVDVEDYDSNDLTKFCPEIGAAYFSRLAVQRQPDTRIHCVREDGTVGILIRDPVEQVRCWVDYETDGVVEDVFVLPGDDEDKVYYSVKRTINGSTVRYLERWALETECVGGTLNKQLDSFILYAGVSTTTITGLTHLEAETVAVWGNGAYLGTYVVASGQITGLSSAVTSAVVGLPYTATYKSSKLAYAAGLGTAIGQRKRVSQIGVGLVNTHKDGLYYGPDFDNLDALPNVEDGATTSADYVWETYDKDMFEFGGRWDTDARICLQATAPKPCTVTHLTMAVTTNDEG